MMFVYLVVMMFMFVMVMKLGVLVNYFIEWSCVIVGFVGFGFVDVIGVVMRKLFVDKVDVVVILFFLFLVF